MGLAIQIGGNTYESGGYVIKSESVFRMHWRHLFVFVNKTIGSPTTIYLPPSPVAWLAYTIKDDKPDAGTNAITIISTNGNIDGNSSITLTQDDAAITLIFDTVNWSVA